MKLLLQIGFAVVLMGVLGGCLYGPGYVRDDGYYYGSRYDYAPRYYGYGPRYYGYGYAYPSLNIGLRYRDHDHSHGHRWHRNHHRH
jgi:hypothetical protein